MNGEKKHISHEEFHKYICRHSTLREVEHSSSLFKCGLHVVTFFQGIQYKKKKTKGVTLQWRKPDKLPQPGDQGQHQ